MNIKEYSPIIQSKHKANLRLYSHQVINNHSLNLCGSSFQIPVPTEMGPVDYYVIDVGLPGIKIYDVEPSGIKPTNP